MKGFKFNWNCKCDSTILVIKLIFNQIDDAATNYPEKVLTTAKHALESFPQQFRFEVAH